MKMPDKHTIDKVLRNAASKEEAKEVIRLPWALKGETLTKRWTPFSPFR